MVINVNSNLNYNTSMMVTIWLLHNYHTVHYFFQEGPKIWFRTTVQEVQDPSQWGGDGGG